MQKTMKAAVVRAFRKPLAIEEVPVPEPGPGEVLVKVIAGGVCHTDLDAVDGDWPAKPHLPFGAHGVPVTAVSPPAFSQALSMVRMKGTVALVGLPPGAFPFERRPCRWRQRRSLRSDHGGRGETTTHERTNT